MAKKNVVSKELLEKFNVWRKESRKLEREIEIFVENKKQQIKIELMELFDDRKEEIMDRKADIWDEVYAELGLNPDQPHTIDARTGEVKLDTDEEVEINGKDLAQFLGKLIGAKPGNIKKATAKVRKTPETAKGQVVDLFNGDKGNDNVH